MKWINRYEWNNRLSIISLFVANENYETHSLHENKLLHRRNCQSIWRGNGKWIQSETESAENMSQYLTGFPGNFFSPITVFLK